MQDPGGRPNTARGGRATSLGVPCEDGFDLGSTRPRTVTVLPTDNDVYRELVREELRRRGLKNPRVKLLGLARADLDGDGINEVIVKAAHYAWRPGLYPPPVGQPGDFNLLLLRWVRNGAAHTTVLGASLAPGTPYDPERAPPCRWRASTGWRGWPT